MYTVGVGFTLKSKFITYATTCLKKYEKYFLQEREYVFRPPNRNNKKSNKKLRSIELSDSEIQYDSSFLFIYTVFYLYKKNVRYDIHSDIYIAQN